MNIAMAWLACSVLTYGITLGYFSHKYETDDYSHVLFAVFFCMFGPFGLLVSFISSGFAKHGLRFRK